MADAVKVERRWETKMMNKTANTAGQKWEENGLWLKAAAAASAQLTAASWQNSHSKTMNPIFPLSLVYPRVKNREGL